ncbi:sensor histidine kinase [Mongoliitalea lutea]|uniref:histidine kinase n=1 Tax=Mongoliitalea lutea TaxID=849756 RepID=A0A8J3CWB2_9BACT|nr:PAS domain S-box protein [Mongoliitalea lutea]GHB35360.1 hypothetical protein GCM10008106_15990 [Mongoliitalea lutea]
MYTSAHILKAIGESYFEIENNASLKKSINTILQKLGQATGVDRVYVFKNHLNEQGEPCMTYTFEWSKEGVESQLDFEYLHLLPWKMFEEIEHDMKTNRVVNALVKDTNNGDFYEAMKAQGILAYLFVPIFAGAYFWGYMGFDNCSAEVLFTEEQVFSLHALASTIGTKILNRKQQKKILKSRKSYYDLISNINDVVFLIDSNGNVSFVNKRWEILSGYAVEETIGVCAYKFYDPIFLPSIDGKRLQIKQGLIEEGTLELKLIRKDNQSIWVRAFAKVLRGKNGVIKGYTGTLVDIHNEKEMLDALLESQEAQQRLNELLQAVNEAHLSFFVEDDFQSPLEVFLDKILQITGSKFGFIGEILYDENGQPFLRSHTLSNLAWDEASAEFFRNNYRAGIDFRNLDTLFGYTLKTGEVVISNNVNADPRAGHTTPKGHPPLERYIGIPVKKAGKFIGMMGFANKPTDYTQEDIDYLEPLISGYANLISAIRINRARKNAESLRQKADEQYKLVSENTRDIIALHDLDMRFLYVSPSIEKVLGVKPEVLIGKRPSEVFQVKEQALSGSGSSEKFVMPHQNMLTGEFVSLEILMTPLKDSNGNVYSFLATSRDVTQREKMLEELKEMLVREQELNQLKTRFISMASHEFRTPLATILSSTDILSLITSQQSLPTVTTEKWDIHLSRINQQVERLTKVISDLLLIGKSTQEKIVITMQQVEIVSFVRNLVDNYPLPEGRKLRFYSKLKELELSTDPIWLSHIVTNLVDNAFKYSEGKQDPEITLLTDEKSAYVEIRDFGIGIPESEQKYIFDSFFRAKNATTIKGTGLGLNIVKEFANRLGIELSFESHENIGTIFKLELPMKNDI